MLRVTLMLGAVVCMAAAPVLAETPTPAQTPASVPVTMDMGEAQAIAAQLAASPPTDFNAYYALKTQLGENGLRFVQSQVLMLSYQQAGLAMTGSVAACRLPDWSHMANAGITLARSSATEADWTANRAQIDQAQAGKTAVGTRLMAGESVDPLYADAEDPARRAKTANPQRAHDYALRLANDQIARGNGNVLRNKALWAKDLGPAALAYMISINAAETCRIDRENTEWVKADIAANGWPRISVSGAATDGDAWLLTQHADHDPAFQHAMLDVLATLLSTKDMSSKNYAFLYDRVARHDNRPQRYGTQGHCTGPGQWEPFDGEDPANLDARRASVGLEPEAKHKTEFAYCTAPVVNVVKF